MRRVVTGILGIGLIALAIVVWVQKFGPAARQHDRAVAADRAAATTRISPRPFVHSVPTWFPTVPGLSPVLPTLTPLPQIELSNERLARLFPAFEHAPFETAGFSALSLPFRYEDPDGLGDPAEANALAFLLSDALDWAPGNYSARHAYFVFAQDPQSMRGLADRYDPAVIAREIQGWTTTHAVGGVLRRTRDGCTGTLEVHAVDGNLVYRKQYPSPRPYFELLGDMAVDAIAHFGPAPSSELVALLHEPRCQHPESIVRLGMAAFEPLRGDRAFDLYAQILHDDPAFAEVRTWWAVQKRWAGGEEGERERQVGQSLHDRITPTAIATFTPGDCRDRELAAEYPAWVARAQLLAGEDSPLATQLRVYNAEHIVRADPKFYRPALAVAARYPNRDGLLNALAESLQFRGCSDAELSASVSAAAIASRYLDPVGDFHQERYDLAGAADLIGRPDVAAAARADGGPPVDSRDLSDMLDTLCNAGRFADALAAFTQAEPVARDKDGRLAAHWAALAAATVGNAAAVARIRESWASTFEVSGMDVLLDARAQADAPNGRVNLLALWKDLFAHQHDVGFIPRLVLAADIDLSRSRNFFRPLVQELASLQPGERLLWPLLDGYERHEPTMWGPYIYDTLLWLHPSDRWVRAAVEQWKSRGRPGRTNFESNLSQVRQTLAPFPPDDAPSFDQDRLVAARAALPKTLGPFGVSGLVHSLLLKPGRSDDVRDVALRFRRLAVDTGDPNVASLATHLVAVTSPHSSPGGSAASRPGRS